MAENGSNSPAFTPPAGYNKITDNAPGIIGVPLDVVGIGFRKSAQAGLMQSSEGTGPVKNLSNGS